MYPRARRSPLEWTFEWAALVGCGGHRSVGRAPCVRLSEMRLALVFCRFQAGFPQLFQGTLRAVPDSSPRASAGLPARPSQMLKPTDRMSFPLVCKRFPWVRVSGPAGLAPEALQERECSCRGFTVGFGQRAWYVFQSASVIFQPASVTQTQLALSAAGATQEV
jgi:hypothetical protein